jgi:hypothetical protein
MLAIVSLHFYKKKSPSTPQLIYFRTLNTCNMCNGYPCLKLLYPLFPCMLIVYCFNLFYIGSVHICYVEATE